MTAKLKLATGLGSLSYAASGGLQNCSQRKESDTAAGRVIVGLILATRTLRNTHRHTNDVIFPCILGRGLFGKRTPKKENTHGDGQEEDKNKNKKKRAFTRGAPQESAHRTVRCPLERKYASLLLSSGACCSERGREQATSAVSHSLSSIAKP